MLRMELIKRIDPWWGEPRFLRLGFPAAHFIFHFGFFWETTTAAVADIWWGAISARCRFNQAFMLDRPRNAQTTSGTIR